MRYRLRTLLIAATIGPPLLAAIWFAGVWILSDWTRLSIIAFLFASVVGMSVYIVGSIALGAAMAWVADLIIDALHGEEKR